MLYLCTAQGKIAWHCKSSNCFSMHPSFPAYLRRCQVFSIPELFSFLALREGTTIGPSLPRRTRELAVLFHVCTRGRVCCFEEFPLARVKASHNSCKHLCDSQILLSKFISLNWSKWNRRVNDLQCYNYSFSWNGDTGTALYQFQVDSLYFHAYFYILQLTKIDYPTIYISFLSKNVCTLHRS